MELFKAYASQKNESVWVHFLNLLNRPGGFIMNMTARVVAKMACWSRELMTGADLQFYLTWLKDQLRLPVMFPGPLPFTIMRIFTFFFFSSNRATSTSRALRGASR